MALSSRGRHLLQLMEGPYYQGAAECAVRPRTKSDPHGFINLRLAESKLVRGLLREKLAAGHLELARRAAAGELDYSYADRTGSRAQFQRSLAAYFSRTLRAPVDPADLVSGAGTTAMVEHAVFALLEPSDGLLVPAPLYPGFLPDLGARTGVELLYMPREPADGFALRPAALEAAAAAAEARGVRPRALLLTSPDNPTARLLEPSLLREIMDVAVARDLHVVCDEIYAGSVFDESRTEYKSLLAVATVDERQRVHIVTGLSKDFPFPALRIGCLISANSEVRAVATALGRFSGISADTMELLASMLGDEAFVEKYMHENRAALARRHAWFRRQLSETLGVADSPRSEAGVFAWVDLRSFLDADSWEAEERLWRRLLECARVNLTRGGGCESPEPGWFRICICDEDEDTIAEALSRIKREVSKL